MSLEHVQLDFENQIFFELISEDGLVVLARCCVGGCCGIDSDKPICRLPLLRGLGLDRIFLKFLRLYCDPHHLVLVINTSQPNEVWLLCCLGN